MNPLKNTLFKIPNFDASSISIQGKGTKKLLVICRKQGFSEVQSTALQKMMSAIKYDYENDIFMMTSDENEQISLSFLDIEYKDLILFGIKPENIGFNVEYKSHEINRLDSRRLLVFEGLDIVLADNNKKLLLWNKLQEMFLK
jgi:ATP-dependent protease Clp ATPase subunit